VGSLPSIGRHPGSYTVLVTWRLRSALAKRSSMNALACLATATLSFQVSRQMPLIAAYADIMLAISLVAAVGVLKF
jgi:hypothetical protein